MLAKLKLPDNPGVYIFRNRQNKPLYIGRATSLADRVRSYFAADIISTRGPRIVDMVTKASNLTWQETNSVLEAIILESELIKRYQPQYNVDERDDKSSNYVIITDEFWPRVFLVRSRNFDQDIKNGTLNYPVKHYFGPYPHGGLIKEALKIIRTIFPFKDKKSFDRRHDLFYRSIGRSPSDNESSHLSYIETIDYLILFFKGKTKELRNKIEDDMHQHAKKQEFEEATRHKKLLYALDHIRDMALLKKEPVIAEGRIRIEAYDIAHLSGMETVGAFVVAHNGQLAPAEYRKFKIAKDANNDLKNLEEILSRRLNHTEWSYPDLIVVDGGQTHLDRAELVLKSRRISIPVVAVTKDERHKAKEVIGHPEVVKKYKEIIITLNAEAHRFTIAYHRQRRNSRLH